MGGLLLYHCTLPHLFQLIDPSFSILTIVCGKKELLFRTEALLLAADCSGSNQQ